jgi:hypothetical protein
VGGLNCCRIVWTVGLVFLGGVARAQGTSDALDPCGARATLRVTADSIGPLPFGASVAALRHICASAYIDTTVNGGNRMRHRPGVLVVPFSSANVWAGRRVMGFFQSIAESDVPDTWIVHPHGPVDLPDGLSMDTPWGIWRDADSSGTMVVGGRIATVRFARWPHWTLYFFTPSTIAGRFSLAEGRTLVDPLAKPTQFEIVVSDSTK